MSDKKFTIGIDTTADTTGAKQAAVALDAVEGSAEALGKELGKPNGAELEKLPAPAKAAAASIYDLEKKLEQLNKELKSLPVGSAQFVALAEKVKSAQSALAGADKEASKLGATVKRSGNAGLAVQEFARGLEDAQYGLRGVQNNIPGLVLALGGGPGLAGVLSIAAVVGGQLWSLLSKGSDEAKDSAIDYLDIAKKLSKEFGNGALEIEKARGDNAAAALAKQKEYATAQQKIADSELTLEKQRIKGDGGVTVAKARLDLSRIEGDLLTATGEKAIKLAKEREEALKRIVALEKQNAELIRQAEERAAQAKVTAAKEALGNADANKDTSAGKAAEKGQALAAVTDALAKAIEVRFRVASDLVAERNAAITQQAKTSNPLESLRLAGEIEALAKSIENTFKNPGQLEAKLTVKRDDADATSKQATENFKAASEYQRAAALALNTATEGLGNLRSGQTQDRKNESELGAISDAGGNDQKIRAAGDKTAQQISQALTDALKDIGKAADSPQVKSAAARIAELAKDGIQKGEQNEVFALFQQLVAKSTASNVENKQLLNKVINIIDSSISGLAGVKARLDEQGRLISGIQNQLSNPNP